MYITADDLARAMGKTELIQTTNDDGRGTEPVALIEVQSGGYLGEDDIERLEDAYGRS